MPFDGSEFLKKPSRPLIARLWESVERLFRVGVPATPNWPDPSDRELTLQLLMTARALIADERHWIQQDYETRDGRFCAVGALRHAARSMAPADPLVPASRLLLSVARERGFSKIEKMNDRSNHEFVLAAFDDAIARAKSFGI